MKLLLLALGALLGSVLLTQVVRQDPGYLLVHYAGWSLESSLAAAMVLLVSVFAILFLALRLMLRLGSAPRRLQAWEQRRARRRSRRALIQGLLELAEGQWTRAERDLARGAQQSETPLLNYLSAARAAQQQGAHERRDHYLRLAHLSLPEAGLAVGLTQAELQLDHQQHEQALATLLHLRDLAPRHGHVLKLLGVLYQRLGDWQQLINLLPDLRRREIESEQDLDALELQAQHGLLLDKAKQASPAALAAHWSALARPLRCHPLMLDTYSATLVRLGEIEAAEALLRESLEHCWSADLVQRYGELPAADCVRQLSSAEGWLRRHSGDAVLLFSLGRLCQRNRLWGKARSYFEASIGIGGKLRPLAYQELGRLLEQIGEPDAALECYRKGLQLSTGEPTQNGRDRPARILPLNGRRNAAEA